MNPVLIFDYDDTLGGVLIDGKIVPGYKAYEDAIKRFGAAVAALGFSGEHAIRIHKDIDEEGCRAEGFADKTRFARSMVSAYRTVAGEQFSAEEAETLYQIGMSVFNDYPYVPLEGALDVLEFFKEHGCYVFIMTKGEYAEQYRKLEESGVLPFADAVRVVSTKDSGAWEDVLNYLDFTGVREPRDFWAIGNSAKADVNPALELGLNAIHLNDPNGWVFEHAAYATPFYGKVLRVISDIREVVDLIPVTTLIEV